MTTAYYTHPECRMHDMGAGHPECPQRLDAIADQLVASGIDIALQHRDAPLATIEQIERAHTANYVTTLKDFLEQVAASGESRHLDPDTVACPHTWRPAPRSPRPRRWRAATSPTRSARCARPGTTRRATRRWVSASSTTSRSEPATRSTCSGSRGSRSSTSTSTTATAPRTSSPATTGC